MTPEPMHHHSIYFFPHLILNENVVSYWRVIKELCHMLLVTTDVKICVIQRLAKFNEFRELIPDVQIICLFHNL